VRWGSRDKAGRYEKCRTVEGLSDSMLETEAALGHRSNLRGVGAVSRTKRRPGSSVVERRGYELWSLVAAFHLLCRTLDQNARDFESFDLLSVVTEFVL
jgi:hypothetical protein